MEMYKGRLINRVLQNAITLIGQLGTVQKWSLITVQVSGSDAKNILLSGMRKHMKKVNCN